MFAFGLATAVRIAGKSADRPHIVAGKSAVQSSVVGVERGAPVSRDRADL